MRKRDRRIDTARTAALIALTAGLWGCERPTAPSWDPAELRAETFTDRSSALVLGQPASATDPADDRPWWYDRHDARLNVGGDPDQPQVVDYIVRTRDRQHSHDDHIHNSYSRSTRTRQRGRLVR